MGSNLYDYIWCPFEVLNLLTFGAVFCFFQIFNSPFGPFRKIAKTIMNSVMPVDASVRLSAYVNQLGLHWTDFIEIFIGDIYTDLSIENVFGYWRFAWRPI
jgi:hypothetical protein